MTSADLEAVKAMLVDAHEKYTGEWKPGFLMLDADHFTGLDIEALAATVLEWFAAREAEAWARGHAEGIEVGESNIQFGAGGDDQ